MDENGLRILVVDDERAIRRYLRTSLSSRGYTVIEAAGGEEALRTAVEAHPDLVILDLGLPDLDGVDVVRRLREWSQVPVLILSVRDREDDKVAALDAGADDYLTKPFGLGELLARIRVAMRHSAASPDEPVYEVGESESGPGAARGDPGGQPGGADPHRIRTAARPGAERGQSPDPQPAAAPGMGSGLCGGIASSAGEYQQFTSKN